MKAILDTNIFVSAFAIPGGKAEEAYRAAVRGEFFLYTSVAILTETARILRGKFDWREEKIRQLIKSVGKVATVIKTKPHLHVLRDEPDNRVLECALEAQANFIVTGDKRLLGLGRFHETEIVTLADFLGRLESLGSEAPEGAGHDHSENSSG